jgi:hypothetical protein
MPPISRKALADETLNRIEALREHCAGICTCASATRVLALKQSRSTSENITKLSRDRNDLREREW